MEHELKTARANVLIVEDERVSRRALAALMSASGYETEAAASAEEALNAVEAASILTSPWSTSTCPGMNGLDFIGQLTQLDPAVFPVLITAANGDNLTACSSSAAWPTCGSRSISTA